jgi:hypothetical protein
VILEQLDVVLVAEPQLAKAFVKYSEQTPININFFNDINYSFFS